MPRIEIAIQPSRENITVFWEIVAFLVNSVVFLLIGFELRPDHLLGDFLMALVLAAALLSARALVVYSFGALIHRQQGNLPLFWRNVIWWGGLRGAVAGRLARLLLEHYEGVSAEPVERDLTLDEMAARIGTTREMVCRVLYRFSDDQLIEITRTEFTLNDIDALAQLTGRTP